MFEDINSHRQAVQEQIQKGFEIGFTESELEKAHKVGDIHPNGKWVWTQLPSGRYDWRVIKKTGGGSGGAAPATAQKTTKSSKKEEEIKGFVNILKQKPNERHLEQMDVDELKRFKDVANRCWLDDENLNRSTRLQCKEWRDLAKKEIVSKDEEARATQQENEYRKQHPNSVTKNSDIQQQASKGKDEAKKDSDEDIKVSDLPEKKMKKIEKELPLTKKIRNQISKEYSEIVKWEKEKEQELKKDFFVNKGDGRIHHNPKYGNKSFNEIWDEWRSSKEHQDRINALVEKMVPYVHELGYNSVGRYVMPSGENGYHFGSPHGQWDPPYWDVIKEMRKLELKQ